MQLIGGNISNSFHSPPVLLTDLVENQCYEQFDLNIVRMPTFGIAALASSAMRSVTTTLLQDSPTRRKPRNSSSVEEEDDEEDSKDVVYKFDSSLDIVPIVTDD